jgi:hypothetical protein
VRPRATLVGATAPEPRHRTHRRRPPHVPAVLAAVAQTEKAMDPGSETLHAEREIDRKATGIRILLTVLFALIWSVVEIALGLVVLVGLVWTLVTRRAPPLRLRTFSNGAIAYAYEMFRYMTQNTPVVPFPFSELPVPRHPPEDLDVDEADGVMREL